MATDWFKLGEAQSEAIPYVTSGNDLIYEFDVAMTCEGCSAAVNRVLGRLKGVEEVSIDLPRRKVFVTSSLPATAVLEALQKCGKECSFVSSSTSQRD